MAITMKKFWSVNYTSGLKIFVDFNIEIKVIDNISQEKIVRFTH